MDTGHRFQPVHLQRYCIVVLMLGLSVSTTAGTSSTRDSIQAVGERQLDSRQLDAALDTFSRLAEAFPDDAHILTRLGRVQLKAEDFKAAKESFEAALKLDEDYAAAHAGLALVYAEMPAKGISAFHNFRRAVGAAKKAIELDPEQADAYRALGEAHERFKEDHEKALGFFDTYLGMEPDDPDGLYYFGLACIQAEAYEKISKHIAPHMAVLEEETRLLPIAAQGHFYEEEYSKALDNFERFLDTVGPGERELYTDIAYVASVEELREYQALPDTTQRKAFQERFWLRRDPDMMTRVNERMVEHYRRVWYARTFFADRVSPWDKRGEVYIRYGKPDYRSRSYQRDLTHTPDVEAVRMRMAASLYGAEASFMTFTGPVFPIRAFRHPITQRTQDALHGFGSADQRDASFLEDGFTSDTDAADEEEFQERDLEGTPLPAPLTRSDYDDQDGARFEEFGNQIARNKFGDYIPVTIHTDMATVPWETWIYTQIQGGIEIVFTDENKSGQFNFAPIPPVTALNNQLVNITRLVKYAPEIIYQNAAHETPDYYRPGIQGPALNFYYDLANFQGSDGRTNVEVYYGIPPEQVRIAEQTDSAQVSVQCAMALADAAHTTIYRDTREFHYEGRADFDRVRGAFLPEMLKTPVPPGKYELQVQIKDLASGHTGLYKQAVEVPDYGVEKLKISDILLASEISDANSAGKFRKGDIRVVPMPTRNYREAQKVYAYYEIYNLKKNRFGQTDYEVEYLVRTVVGRSEGVVGAITSLFKRRKTQVSVSYEHAGTATTEQQYFEIDLDKARPGVQVLEVKIKDRVSGKSDTREIQFRYGI